MLKVAKYGVKQVTKLLIVPQYKICLGNISNFQGFNF